MHDNSVLLVKICQDLIHEVGEMVTGDCFSTQG